MSHTHDQIPGLHPVVSMIISASFVWLSVAAPHLVGANEWRIPGGLMDCFQIAAWSGAAGTFIIAALNYFGVKWSPFKKKK
jgi:hypothetical protein